MQESPDRVISSGGQYFPAEKTAGDAAGDIPPIRFGEVLKEYRQKARLSQQALGELMDVSRNTVINWEADRNRPEYDMLPRLCSVLALPLGTLFGTDTAGASDPTERRLVGTYRQLSPVGKKILLRTALVMLDEELYAKDAMFAEAYQIFAEYESAVAAGDGCEFGDTLPRPVILRKNGRNNHADAIVRICGDSMEPVYLNGDTVYFRYAHEAAPGSDVVCSTNRGAIVKRVSEDGTLCSINSARPFNMDTEADNIRVIGTVTGIVVPVDLPEKTDESLLREIFHDKLCLFREKYGLSDWE